MDNRPNQNFVEQWRESEVAHQGLQITKRADERLLARLATSPSPRWRPAVVGAVVAGLALLVLLRRPQAPPTETVPVSFSSMACVPDQVSSRLPLPMGCTLELPSVGGKLEALSDAILRHSDHGIHLVAGRVRFSVQRRAGAPLVVLVSEGRIEVMGTVFTVEQNTASGRVTLHEGRIDWIARQSDRRMLEPGETLRWGVPRTWTATQVDEAVSDVTRLRRLGQFREAAKRLDELAGAPLPPSAAEVLSYERGLILQNDLHDLPRACRHWITHSKRFDSGRYRPQLEEAHEKCKATGNAEGAER